MRKCTISLKGMIKCDDIVYKSSRKYEKRKESTEKFEKVSKNVILFISCTVKEKRWRGMWVVKKAQKTSSKQRIFSGEKYGGYFLILVVKCNLCH